MRRNRSVARIREGAPPWTSAARSSCPSTARPPGRRSPTSTAGSTPDGSLDLEPGAEGELTLPDGETRWATVEDVQRRRAAGVLVARPRRARDARRGHAASTPTRAARRGSSSSSAATPSQPICGSPWAGGASERPARAQRRRRDGLAELSDRQRLGLSGLDWEPPLARLRARPRPRRAPDACEADAGGLRGARRPDAPRRPARGRGRRGGHGDRDRRAAADQPPGRRQAPRPARAAQLVDAPARRPRDALSGDPRPRSPTRSAG